MRGRNLKAARVYQTATKLAEAMASSRGRENFVEPAWYRTIGAIPPGEILTRTQPPQHREVKAHARMRKPSKLFKPQLLDYEEDQLRREFFKDHPWELARPRIVLENDGRDAQQLDWSRIRQPGMSLSGENVVQRQLWIMQNMPGTTKSAAYDVARKEFYALRREEEIERRVQREEALWTGASFGLNPLEAGMLVEDKAYNNWLERAQVEVHTLKTTRDSAQTLQDEEEEDEALLRGGASEEIDASSV